MNSLDAMNELTTDALSDPEYALPIIRDYLNGGGVLSAGWALALVNEIERLHIDIDADTESAMRHLGVHLSHCNFGENAGGCKYGDADCPALAGWAWFGQALDRR